MKKVNNFQIAKSTVHCNSNSMIFLFNENLKQLFFCPDVSKEGAIKLFPCIESLVDIELQPNTK